jgi:DNA invertase Pin-like site-specific DNA recombinase
MCGVFAQFERAMIQERVKAGLSRAKAQGKTLGRPRVSPAVEAKVRELRETGMGMIRIAREAGTGGHCATHLAGSVERLLSFLRILLKMTAVSDRR